MICMLRLHRLPKFGRTMRQLNLQSSMAASVLPPRHHFSRCTFCICRRCDAVTARCERKVISLTEKPIGTPPIPYPYKKRAFRLSLPYSAVNGNNAMLRARLIASVTWR